ncbi:MAG: HlyD family efflux transporter periplasmic adaptor subunit [Acidobacteriia bacterium]|nr:HlyD family efflux transporter periplasmic adaptor subunit [Terriglobia bacterium]
MDIVREGARRRRITRWVVISIIVVIFVSGTTVVLSRLRPALQPVDRSIVVIDTVKRGPLIREVHGTGTLVPEDIRWIPASTDARVENIVLRPGAVVKADSIIVELTNPIVEQAAQDAEMQLKAGEADLEKLRAQVQSDYLNEQANAAQIQSLYRQARLQADANNQLAKEGLIADLTVKLSNLSASELENRSKLEDQRLQQLKTSNAATLAAQQAKVEQFRTFYNLKRQQVEMLHVRAGINGVLQLVPVEVGQQVAPGANLARVADPTRLKAEVKIAETQAKDVQIGQVASVDTRNGVVPGRVSRIDPSVVAGTVTVDVTFTGSLPPGTARPDLSVDGTIELEHMSNVLYVGRPALMQENGPVGLFKLVDDGREAVRTTVKLGRASVTAVEIVDGLKEGDQVILSDMSQYDSHDRIRLN